MATTNVKILLRRGLRSEIGPDTLMTGELGFADDTNQLFIGIDTAIDEVQVDAFANAQATVQSVLDLYTTEPGLIIDEDLIIRRVDDVDALVSYLQTHVSDYAYHRQNLEVLTEDSYMQLYAYRHLKKFQAVEGLRSSMFTRTINDTSGTFLSFDSISTTALTIDYVLIQTVTDDEDPTVVNKFVRNGVIQVVNGTQHQIPKAKLTDNSTEIWQNFDNDTGDLQDTDTNEFSNISFSTELVLAGSQGTDPIMPPTDRLKISYTQNDNCITEINYTIKRWSL